MSLAFFLENKGYSLKLLLCLEFEPDIGGSHLIAPLSFYFENPLPLWRSKYLFQFSDVESFVISISTGI